jgi:hypothetical protein
MFDADGTPDVSVAAALCAASTWPAITDCFEGDDGSLLCDVEYVLAPPVLALYLRPRPILVVEALPKSLGPACCGCQLLDKLLTYIEYTGSYTRDLGELCRHVPTFHMRGPHMLDSVLLPVGELLSLYDTDASVGSRALLSSLLAAISAITLLELLPHPPQIEDRNSRARRRPETKLREGEGEVQLKGALRGALRSSLGGTPDRRRGCSPRMPL